MATRRPLVVVSGVTSELPVGDFVTGASAGSIVAGSGLDGGGALTGGSVTVNVSLAAAPSGLIFVGDSLGIDGSAQASGNAALSAASVAQASGNAALSSVAGKYDKTGGPISGPAFTQSQTFGVPSGILGSGVIVLNLGERDNFEVTLTAGTSTLASPINASGGQCGAIIVRQDSVGSRLLTYSGSWSFASNTAPTLTTGASGVDMLGFYVVNPNRINIVSNLNYGSGTVS
jgi:hypothetical protein